MSFRGNGRETCGGVALHGKPVTPKALETNRPRLLDPRGLALLCFAALGWHQRGRLPGCELAVGAQDRPHGAWGGFTCENRYPKPGGCCQVVVLVSLVISVVDQDEKGTEACLVLRVRIRKKPKKPTMLRHPHFESNPRILSVRFSLAKFLWFLVRPVFQTRTRWCWSLHFLKVPF